MIPRDALLSRSRPYPSPTSGRGDDRVERAAKQLAGRSVRVPGSPRGGFKFPFGDNLSVFLEALSRAAAELGPAGVQMVYDVLVAPLRAYELSAPCEGMRRILLLTSGVLEDSEDPLVLAARLTIPAQKRGPWDNAACAVTSIPAHEPVLTAALETIALEILPAQAAYPDPDRTHPPGVLWLGGSASELLDDGAWLERLAAAAAVRGYGLDVLQQPARHHAEVMDRINAFTGAMVVIWTPFAGTRYDAYAKAVTSAEPVYIHDRTVDAAVATFRDELDMCAEQRGEDEEIEHAAGERTPPEDGEIRFYKKHFARRGGGDKMLDWHDCGHDRWTESAYAPQARMGIEKLERGHPIQKLQKCLTCTGGGVWRVTF